jgi:hypothetical protein
MNREQILNEIRRLAVANGGLVPGRLNFERETGAKEHDWRGRYWARWSDAVREAGLEPNQKTVAFDEGFLLDKLAALTREIGHFPTSSELRLRATNDPSFPNDKVYRRFGLKPQLIQKLLGYCQKSAGYEDVVSHCHRATDLKRPAAFDADDVEEIVGFVYLLKSGRHFKIGRSNAVGRRERELSIQLPERASVIHAIRTDDPVGIEAYWHKSFDSKRKNGEWFELDNAEIKAFKKRKFM